MKKILSMTRRDFATSASVQARRIHGTLFSATIAPLSGAERARCSCVVSKKVAAKAVDRNRIKRHCREAARASLQDKRVHALVALYAKQQARSATPEELKRDVCTLVSKIPLVSSVDR